MSTEENKALVRRLFAAWNDVWLPTGDRTAVERFLAPDVVSHTGSTTMTSREEWLQLEEQFNRAFPDLHFAIEDQIAEGDLVVTRFTVRGSHRGELMGIAPTGKVVLLTGILISRLSGGQVVERWDEYDALGLMQQLGVLPELGPA